MDASIYRLRNQDILLLCVLALLFLGAIMVQSAAMNVTGDVQWQWTQRGTRHLLYAGVAIVMFAVVGRLNYAHLARREIRWWGNAVLLLIGVALLACVFVLVPGIGIEVNGARRWLRLGPIQFQPSELAKWGVVLFLAWWLTHPANDVRRFFRGLMVTL